MYLDYHILWPNSAFGPIFWSDVMSAPVFSVVEVAWRLVRYIVGQTFHEMSGWPGPVKDVSVKEDQVLDCLKMSLIHICIAYDSCRAMILKRLHSRQIRVASSIPLHELHCNAGCCPGLSGPTLWRQRHSWSTCAANKRCSR